MTEQEQILATTNMKPVVCSCNTCKNMCKTAPCIGTPDDILAIAEAGYIDKLQQTKYCATARWGLPIVDMIAPLQLDNGNCAFLTEEGLCELHDQGLKPTEGKLANCKVNEWKGLPTPAAVAATWLAKRNHQTVESIKTMMINRLHTIFSDFLKSNGAYE